MSNCVLVMWGDFGEGVRFRSKLLDWFLFVVQGG